jgi:hypothetical protein
LIEEKQWTKIWAPGKTTPQKTVADGPFLYYKNADMGYLVRTYYKPYYKLKMVRTFTPCPHIYPTYKRCPHILLHAMSAHFTPLISL